MNKVILIFVFFSTSMLVAQDSDDDKLTIEKGTWNIGGNFSLNVSKDEGSIESQNSFGSSKNLGFAVFPNVGYAVANNLMIGLSAGFGGSTRESFTEVNQIRDSDNSAETNSWSLGPYVRGFLPLGKKNNFARSG